MAEKKKNAPKVRQPSTGDYLGALKDMFVVNPRNSPAATLGGAAYDYATRSTPQTVVRDIRSGVQGAEDWLRKQNKALRANPVTATLQMLKAGYIDPLADPYRVFKQAATERSRGNESGGAKLAAMVPLAVAGVLPQLRGAGNVAADVGVEAATKATVKGAAKATPPLKVTPKAKPASAMTVTPKASTPKAKTTSAEVRTSGAITRPDDKFRGEGTPRITVQKTEKPFVVRITGQSQIDDMIASGLVRPKEGGYGKQNSPQIYFGESDLALPTDIFGKPQPGRFVLAGKSGNLAGKEGPISIDDLEHIWEDVDGEIVDILPDVLRKNQEFVPTSAPEMTVTPFTATPPLKVTPKAKPASAMTVTPKAKRASTPQIAALKDVRPSTDDVYQVMDANTTAGKVTGDKMVPIDKLVGGVTEAVDDARRVDQLVEQMSSPEGYVSRLIVDDAGNVIEGQHRLEALRRLGATKVPVTQYADLERGIPFADVRDAAAAQGIHPDQANQIAKQLAEIYADEGGNMAEVMNYGAPKGFEAAWNAAVGAMPSNPLAVKAFADINADLYGLRKTKDLPRLQASPVKKERFSVAPTPDKISLGDYEGRPFIISMADRTAAGDRVTGIGDVDLNLPVDLQGGQDFMFKPTADDLVWASEPAPVSNIMNLARQLYNETGEKPILMPYRMGGGGSDFATFTGETMMSYADAALGKSDKTDMNRLIEKYIPGFAGISNPEGYRQFADLSGDKRKRLQLDISNTFGEAGGGLTLPMTRAVVADPAQLNKPSFFLQNVGEIDPTADVVTSTGHRTYSRGVPGRGLGVLGEDINVAQLLPNLSKIYQIGDPRAFRGQNADFTDYGRGLKIDEEAAMREKALRQGKIPKIYNTERGGTSKYMMSGAKFGVLTPELLRLLAGE